MFETESDKTPLQQKLDEFGQQLSKVRALPLDQSLKGYEQKTWENLFILLSFINKKCI